VGRDIRLDATGLNVTEYITGAAQEYDAVTGWIRFVPFEFVVRNFDFRSDVDVRPAARFVGPIIGDCRVGFAVSDMDVICPVSVGLTATRRVWNIRLHQGLVPSPNFGTNSFPLSGVTGVHTSNQAAENTETKDDAFHPCAPAISGAINEAIFVPEMVRCGKLHEKLVPHR
jgi:hypothetical protein